MKIQIGSFLLLLCGIASKAQVPTPDHIVIVVLENRYFNNIVGYQYAPYINDSLIAKGALFTQSFGLAHPSQPNYIHLFSGSNQGVTTDDNPKNVPFTTANLGASLLAKGLTFTGFAEDMPSSGYTDSAYTSSSGGIYVRRHCPWIDWQDATTNGIPAALSLPLSSFPTDYSKLPTVSFVIPNLQHDMHYPQGYRSAADTWLSNNLELYNLWAKSHNSLLIITFDEDDESSPNINQITTIFVGQMVKPGQYSETINHHNVLRTIEDMYGLPYAGNSANVTAITDCWKTAQTISFGSLSSKKYGDAAFDLTATASSGLPVSYISSDPTIAFINGATVTIQKPGTVTITAFQSGNDTYAPAIQVQQTFTITKGDQTITFPPISDVTLGCAAFNLTATANSDLAIIYSAMDNKVIISGNQVTPILAGHETITADQSGNSFYNAAASVPQSFCINPPKPVASVSNPGSPLPILSSSASTGNQWYLNGVAIINETNTTLHVTTTGNYAVGVTIDNCQSVLSENVSLTVTGDLTFLQNISLFPNPSSDFIYINGSFNDLSNSLLLNALGQQATIHFDTDGELAKADIRTLPSGLYVLQIPEQGKIQMLRFVKR